LFIFDVFGEVGFDSLGEFTTSQHDPSSATPAFQANVRAETDNGPFIGTARVLLAQAQMVVQAKIGKHIIYRFKARDRGLYIDL
jgi:hypothetical protein